MSAYVIQAAQPLLAASPAALPDPTPWHVLWTHSHCEQLVHDQLAARGFHPFLPKIQVWSRRGRVKQLVPVPMFPGYLFLNDPLDKPRHVEARKARGLVRVLGESWDRLAAVPEREIDAIRRVVEARISASPHPYFKEGRRVRIASGPLAGVEGILKKYRPGKGLLILSVDLLQRSVAVEVDCTDVSPA